MGHVVRGRPRPAGRAAALAVAALLAAGCGPPPPLVERMEQGTWQAQDHKLVALAGRRDGADLTFTLELQGSSRMVVEGQVHIDPRPRLVGARWREDDPAGPREGHVASSSLDFIGGQGGRPGLGGQLVLSADGAPLYRINLPITPLQSAP